MKAPSHPGEILQAMYLEPLNVTITRAAEALAASARDSPFAISRTRIILCELRWLRARVR
jgi:plasmid maintenance system antidote protein VapI